VAASSRLYTQVQGASDTVKLEAGACQLSQHTQLVRWWPSLATCTRSATSVEAPSL
jgi:hypothetical protein